MIQHRLFVLLIAVASQGELGYHEGKSDLGAWIKFCYILPGKCGMSKLEEDMAYIKMSRGEEYVLTLKQLKRKYPEGKKSL